MSHRTARWVANTTPGSAPPPPTRVVSSSVPPTIYPESSVSNPYASRYNGRSSRRSVSVGHYDGSHSGSSRTHSSSYARSSHARSHSHSHSSTPLQTFYAPPEQPIIARTSDADGHTDSYMIIPAKGQRVEILHPTPVRPSSTPPSHSGSYYSSTKEKPLLRRLFDKVEWGNKSSTSTSSSHSRGRRNSTGGGSYHSSSGSGSGGWTVVSGKTASRASSRGSGASGTTTRVGRYNVVYV